MAGLGFMAAHGLAAGLCFAAGLGFPAVIGLAAVLDFVAGLGFALGQNSDMWQASA